MKKEENQNNWLKETARDTIAIGGLLFYIMFIARALIAPYYNYAIQLIIALIIFQIALFLVKNTEHHVGRGLIAAIFTIMFYNVQSFTIFAVIVYIALLASAIYLQKTKSQIIKGLILGIASSAAAYYLTPYLLNLL